MRSECPMRSAENVKSFVKVKSFLTAGLKSTNFNTVTILFSSITQKRQSQFRANLPASLNPEDSFNPGMAAETKDSGSEFVVMCSDIKQGAGGRRLREAYED